ncbi:type III pantothenate kinase [Peptococcaceae bacterium]|nr:type III pantothenate kinase [Peptococcaceae bacterium]
MLLAFDIGNTNTVLGVFDGEKLIANWSVSTEHSRTADEYIIMLKKLFHICSINIKDVKSVIISSVVPQTMRHLNEMSRKYFGVEPFIVGAKISASTGIKIKIDNPDELGADRIVNAVAAYTLYGGPVIIVDFGTATTFCVVNERGEYLGGAITPGIGISTEALFAHAARLPRVELKIPPSVIGRNTVHSIQSGVIFGYAGLVDAMIRRIKKETGECQVVATGGLSGLICDVSEEITKHEPLLTLIGLHLIYNRIHAKTHEQSD